MDWFLYDKGLRNERVNTYFIKVVPSKWRMGEDVVSSSSFTPEFHVIFHVI